MDKKYFFNNFLNEDSFLIASLWEDFELCLDIDYPVHSQVFLPPSIWRKLEEIFSNYKIRVATKGLTSFSEKKVVIFYPKDFDLNSFHPPITFFKVIGSNKFKNLQHKDFLGTIMSLGIKRETFGDIIVEDNLAYSVAFDDIYKIISNNLSQINTIPVKVTLEEKENIPLPKFNEISISIPSLRLDSIISAITKLSRTESCNLIERGDIKVNYQIEKNKSKSLEEDAVLTIYKFGKFTILHSLGETKKGKIKLLVKQHI